MTDTTTAHAHGCHSMPTRRLRRRHDETFCKLTNNQHLEHGVHQKSESNYCPRLVNWSVPDFKKLYFLLEAMFASSAAVTARFDIDFQYKKQHLWPEEDADGMRSVLRHSTLADQDCLHALVRRSYHGASRVALCNPEELAAKIGERVSLLLAPPYFALHPAPDILLGVEVG